MTSASEENTALLARAAIGRRDFAAAERALAEADALVDAGKLKVHVSRTYPLAQAKDALLEIASGKVRGKLVLAITEA